ncbi:MAG: hypothetical protein FE048_00960 [Thermoplasmata archaeon]|nr:MAG: hypothetical protein FE048_00960 [Thermoplasmata archaeon]
MAEKIGIMNGKIIRIKENPSLIKKMFLKKEKMENVIASPHPMGLTKDEIERLEKYCSSVYVFITIHSLPSFLLRFS